MRKLLALTFLLPALAFGQTYNAFKPANGILKGATTTYVTTAATISDIVALATGTCNASAYISGTGACTAPPGATTNVVYNNAGAFGANSGFTYNGTNSISVTDQMTALRMAVTGSTAPVIGMYSGGTVRLSFATASTERAAFNSTGLFQYSNGINSAGTKFTTTGCSVSSTTGGSTAGTFTLGANACSVVVTMTSSTAFNGWSCQAHDRTAVTSLIGGESASTTTTATFTIPAGAGATDVISFACIGY
jgi:hypothetical protein